MSKRVTKFSLFPEDEADIEYDYQVVLDEGIDVEVGDVFILGDHILMCGDATNLDHVTKLAGGVKADLWITDPPYNVAYQGATEDKLTIMNDEMDDSSFRQFIVNSYKSVVENLKDGSSYYIFHADSEGYNFRGGVAGRWTGPAPDSNLEKELTRYG